MEATIIDDQMEHKPETNVSGTTYMYYGESKRIWKQIHLQGLL